MVTLAICGCGNRGLYAYAEYALRDNSELKVVAGADILPERLELLKDIYGVKDEMCFSSDNELLNQGKIADALLIATPDRLHADEAIKALRLGYDLILEKPISPFLDKCLELLDVHKENYQNVVVCHVLRYSPFYKEIDRILSEGTIGEIRTITMSENVGYWHQCHSFVRGNWANSDVTSPMILQKSCHDMDLFRWLTNKKCLSLNSYGDLSYFNKDHKPKDAANRCLDCKHKDSCLFSAKKIYIDDKRTGVKHIGDNWPVQVVAYKPTEEKVLEALKDGPYGRCVFDCDNNVVDHQTINMLFEDNVIGTFTMTAFTDDSYRTIKIDGTKGELYGRLNEFKITVRRFGEKEEIIDLGKFKEASTGHGGGDEGLAKDFVDLVEGKITNNRTSLDISIDSHIMALAAEYSRLHNGETVNLKEFAKLK